MKKYISTAAMVLFCYTAAMTVVSAHGTGAIRLDEAKKIALHTVNGKIVNIGLEHEDNHLVYDVDMKKGGDTLEVIINATTGEVMELKKEITNFKR